MGFKSLSIAALSLFLGSQAQVFSPAPSALLTRTPSPANPTGTAEPLLQLGDINPPMGTLFQDVNSPIQSLGVALFDFDNDGDADLYATNGPNGDNVLFVNDGNGGFSPFTGLSGLALNSLDCRATCAADFDNDGFTDLYVICIEPNDTNLTIAQWFPANVLLRNNGGRSFTRVSTANAPGNGGAFHCSVADFNGDGYVDIFLPNNYHDPSEPGLTGTVEFVDSNANHLPDQLYLSNGNPAALSFSELALEAGLLETNLVTTNTGEFLPNFVSGAFDYDFDGDIDIFVGGDQGPGFFGAAFTNGDLRGVLRRYNNDGQGNFVDNSPPEFSDVLSGVGVWMGVAAADYDCDSDIDHFWSNVGALPTVLFSLPSTFNPQLFFTDVDGSDYTQVSTSTDLASFSNLTFGWGSVPIDFDNDGDFDIATLGDLASAGFPVNMKDDYGILWENVGSCTGNLNWNQNGFDRDFHMRRMDFGLFVGDLNGDGLDDLVSASNADIPQSTNFTSPFVISPLTAGIGADLGFVFLQSPPGINATNNKPEIGAFNAGTVWVEMNTFANPGNFIKVVARGGAGFIPGSVVNRDCIGCTITVGQSSLPILSGSSISGTDFFTKNFGLGAETSSTVTVRFPQSNQLFTIANVPAGTRLVVPEIPCASTDTDCIENALTQAISSGLLTSDEATPLITALGLNPDVSETQNVNDDSSDDIRPAEIAGIVIAVVLGTAIAVALCILVVIGVLLLKKE